MKECLKNFKDIIPDDKRDKYHLIFGKQIFDTYDTLDELKKDLYGKYSTLQLVAYIPSPPKEDK